MKITKKILALVMSIAMLSSLFVFSAQAISYLPGQTAGDLSLKIVADKTEVKPGDTVTFSIYVDNNGNSTYKDFGPWMTTIVYNGALIAPITTTNTTFREYVNECANFMKQTSTVNFAYPVAQLTGLTAEEKTHYTKAIMMNGVVDTSLTTNAAGNGWTPANATTAQCTFKMVVAGDAAPGSEIWVGNHEATYTKGVSYMSPAGGSRYANTAYNLTNTMVKLTVASAAPTYTVEKAKSQALFTGTKPTPDDAFTYRLTSKISAADLTAMNSGSNTITALGFIAANSDVTTVADAKAAVEAGKALPTGWKNATTTYISQADASSTKAADAFFGCRIQNISHASQDKDITCVAYVAYSDGTTTHYVWYTSPVTANVSTGYSAAVNQWAGK